MAEGRTRKRTRHKMLCGADCQSEKRWRDSHEREKRRNETNNEHHLAALWYYLNEDVGAEKTRTGLRGRPRHFLGFVSPAPASPRSLPKTPSEFDILDNGVAGDDGGGGKGELVNR